MSSAPCFGSPTCMSFWWMLLLPWKLDVGSCELLPRLNQIANPWAQSWFFFHPYAIVPSPRLQSRWSDLKQLCSLRIIFLCLFGKGMGSVVFTSSVLSTCLIWYVVFFCEAWHGHINQRDAWSRIGKHQLSQSFSIKLNLLGDFSIKS
jgi:hypothetical protein